MDSIVSAACELIGQNKSFVLATIIRHRGSAPRTSGTRMLITADRQIVGTIGGGLLEAEAIDTAAGMGPESPARLLEFDLSNQDAANMEMICGGMVQVLLDYVCPSKGNRELFKSWRDALANGSRAMLVSVFDVAETAPADHVERALLRSDDRMQGHLNLSDSARRELSELVTSAAHVQVLDLDGKMVVADPGRIGQTLYIFGGGHVARPTSHLAAMTGFDVVVIDDRSEFADPVRFPEAVAVNTIAGFDRAFENLTVTADTYIIIVTRGHLHDRGVLEQALKTPAAYIGMIGSRRKRDAIYDRLLKDGFTQADIDRVHCPIGLKIGADTPEEIAVSIVAELIAVRAGSAG